MKIKTQAAGDRESGSRRTGEIERDGERKQIKIIRQNGKLENGIVVANEKYS